MGELFWNKIAGAVLASLLVIFVLNEAGHIVFHPHELHEDAYPWEVEEADGTGGGAEEAAPDLGTLLAAASASSGERVARQCVSCHTFEQGAPNGQGPNLWGVVGRTPGSVAGFAYSAAMSGAGEPWTYEHLFQYLENPRREMPGTNMTFAGIRAPESRADLLAYLQTLSADPVAFPEPAPPAEEAAPEGEGAAGETDEAGEEAPAEEDAGE